MQIKIEIDVRPDELRRFLGLPDVAGLQDDIIAFMRDKLEAAGEFDAGTFVKHNVETLRKNPAWQKLVARVRIAEAIDDVAAAAMQVAAQPDAKSAKTARPAKSSTRSRRRSSGSTKK